LEKGRLSGRIALITGASRGIGQAVAEHYAKEGAELILVARTIGGLEETDDSIRKISGRNTVLVPMDLTDLNAIDRLGQAIYDRFKRLDILVCNAGQFHSLAPLGHIEPKHWDEEMAVNLTAPWRLIRSLDPLLRQSPAGRGIFVTTGATLTPRAYWGSYAVSKMAMEMLVKIYAEEVLLTQVKVNLLDPGRVRTSMRAKAYPGENPLSVPDPSYVTEAFVRLAEAGFLENGQRFHVNDFQPHLTT